MRMCESTETRVVSPRVMTSTIQSGKPPTDQSAPTRMADADEASRPRARSNADVWHIHRSCSGWRSTQT